MKGDQFRPGGAPTEILDGENFVSDPLPQCDICGLIPEPATRYCGRCWYWVTKYGAPDAREILGFDYRFFEDDDAPPGEREGRE